MTATIVRWRWPLLLAGLVALALGLAWADSVLIGHFPHPMAKVSAAGPLPLPLDRGDRIPGLRVLAPVGGLFSFWWFVSLLVGLVAISVLVVVAVPRRVRTAIDHLSAGGGPLVALFAGVASLLLLAAFSFVVRLSVVLLPLVGVIWALGALGILFGAASLGLFLGGLLRRLLGPVHPLLAAFSGLLLMANLALIPYAGVAVLAVLGLTSLGVSVMTRFGSARGWALDELEW